MESLQDRVRRQTEPGPNGCWLWTGPLAKRGYGKAKLNGQQTTAPRVAYIAFVAEMPAGHTIDHLCRNPRCVNPEHLEAVTLAENIRRARALITHCPQGHPYDEANTLHHGGRRHCKACRAARHRRWREARRLVDYPS